MWVYVKQTFESNYFWKLTTVTEALCLDLYQKDVADKVQFCSFRLLYTHSHLDMKGSKAWRN